MFDLTAGGIFNLVIVLITGYLCYRALVDNKREVIALTVIFFVASFFLMDLRYTDRSETLQKNIRSLDTSLSKYTNIASIDADWKCLHENPDSQSQSALFARLLGEDLEEALLYRNANEVPFSNPYRGLRLISLRLQLLDTVTTGVRAISVDPREFDDIAKVIPVYEAAVARFAKSVPKAKRLYVLPDTLFASDNDSRIKELMGNYGTADWRVSEKMAKSHILFGMVNLVYPRITRHIQQDIQCFGIPDSTFVSFIGGIQKKHEYDLFLATKGDPANRDIIMGATRSGSGKITYYTSGHNELQILLDRYERVESCSLLEILDLGRQRLRATSHRIMREP